MSGEADIVKGRIKEAADVLTNNEKLRADGKTDQAVGKVKQTARKVVDAAKDAAKKTAVKEQVLQQTQNEEMEKFREQEHVTAKAATKAGGAEDNYQSQESLAAYVDKEDTQLKDADHQIDDLKQRVDKLEGDEKAGLNKQVDRLQELRTRAGDKLSD